MTVILPSVVSIKRKIDYKSNVLIVHNEYQGNVPVWKGEVSYFGNTGDILKRKDVK